MRPVLACLALTCVALANPAQAATPPKFVVKPGKKLNFGRVAVGKSKTMWIRISNKGAGTINVSWDPRPSAEFENSYGGTGLNAGRTFKWKFAFQPSDKGHFEAPLTFTTSDPQRPSVTITLAGTGYFRR